MGDPRHDLGLAAEAAVVGWLTDAGWRVIERRARSPTGGEVDIVAIDPERTLVAVEVRARRTRRAGEAALSVDQRRVMRLRRHPGQHRRWRGGTGISPCASTS